MGTARANACRVFLVVAMTVALAACGATGSVKKNADDRNARFAVTANVPDGLPIQFVGTINIRH